MENSEPLWAIVEVMGHSKYAGRVSEHTGLGVPLVRVEVPQVGDRQSYEKLLGASAIFRITPCTQETALEAAKQFREEPLSLVDIHAVGRQKPMPSFLEQHDFEDEDE